MECIQMLKTFDRDHLVVVQFGLPKMKGHFLGETEIDIKEGNFIKAKLGNSLPPPDRGQFDTDWNANARDFVNLCGGNIPDPEVSESKPQPTPQQAESASLALSKKLQAEEEESAKKSISIQPLQQPAIKQPVQQPAIQQPVQQQQQYIQQPVQVAQPVYSAQVAPTSQIMSRDLRLLQTSTLQGKWGFMGWVCCQIGCGRETWTRVDDDTIKAKGCFCLWCFMPLPVNQTYKRIHGSNTFKHPYGTLTFTDANTASTGGCLLGSVTRQS